MGGALVAGVGLLKKVDEKRVAITHQQRGLIRHFAWFRRILLLGGGLLLATTALVVGAQVASANTSVTLYVSTAGTVTTGCTASGTGACETIQEGVAAAEALSSSDVTVEVAAGTYDEYDTIAVPSGDTLTLQGAGASTTTVNGGSNGSVFTVSSGTATIDGFTITDGLVTYGAGVNNAGTATLTDDTFSGDTADFGGGVYNAAAATATLTDDTFSGDSAEEGGGVYNDSGTATLTDDTFSEDSVSYAGGGVSNDGTATLTDDTFSGDSTPSSYGYGGGVYNDGTASLTDDTLSGDSADFGGGVYNDSGTATISNSILDGAPCGGTIKDGGFNVESDDTCGFVTNDLVSNTNINLASSLVANGSSGPETLAITSDSSAFEEVPAADCTVSTDERGDPRPGIPGANCDAGAFEYQAQTQTITMAATGSPTFDQSGSYNVDASSNDSGATLAYTIDSSGNTAGCTVAPSSGVVSFTGLGGCTIDVNSAAQGTYAAAPQAQQVLTVAAGVQATLVVNSTSATYPYSLVLTTTGGSGGGAVTYVVNTGGTASGCTNTSGTLTATSAGTCFVTATKAADADYASASSVQTTVTFSLATQATLVVNSTSATYPYSLVLTTTGGSGTGAVSYAVTAAGSAGCSLTGGGTTLSATSAGTCTVTATKAADASYNAASSTATTITFAPLPPPLLSPPPPPSRATTWENCSSSGPLGTCSATNDGTTANGSGEGAMTVSQYSSDPVGSPTFSASGEYFDVEIASGSSFSSLTITDCNVNGGTSLEWWSPLADAGAGAWEPVSPTPDYSAGPPACVSATISSTSSPTLAQLTGTVFAAASVTPVKATSKTALKLSERKVTYGRERHEHLSVTVSPQFSGSTPTGKVTIKASTRTLCVIRLSSGKGKCTLSAKRLNAGTYHLVATYGAGTNFKGSTSAKETLTVVK
jgi:hypothetical protein